MFKKGALLLWMAALMIIVGPASATERVVVGEFITNTS